MFESKPTHSFGAKLSYPARSTTKLIRCAEPALNPIYKYGYNDPADHRQNGVFVEGWGERLIKLASVMDKLNNKDGKDRIRLASQGGEPD